MKRALALLVGLVLLTLSACASRVTEPLPAAESPPSITPTLPQPVDATPSTSPEEIATASLTTSEVTHTSLTHYHLAVELNYAAKTLAATQTISYTNNTDLAIDSLPILVPPAEVEGVFLLTAIHTEPASLHTETIMDRAQIDLTFDPPLAPAQEVTIHLEYQLRLPMRYAAPGYTDRQVLLADWYPLIPPYLQGHEWLINPPGWVGEHLVYPLINFGLVFCLVPSPNDLVVAASAPVLSTQEGCYHYSTQEVRNFSLAISPYYQVTAAESELVTAWAYTFREHAPLGQRAADLAIEAWATFTDLYGPNGRAFLSIVEADMFDGLESDGLIYLSEWYYQTADFSPQNYFELLIVHETAHQWFYGYVHNDQAQEPWLDEALATYSELLFYEAHHPQLADWWWDFRVDTYDPQGAVNASIYEFNQYRPYINAVYLRGAEFIHALRREVGDQAFFAGLHNYLHSYGINDNFRDSTDFFSAFDEVSDVDLTAIRADYFQ